ncbi:MAG: inositol monophosphatase family protein [Pleomorphochaeta sp.]
MKELKEFLLTIIKEAGNIALEYFNKEIENKSFSKGLGVDVVSNADIEVEKYLRGIIKNRYPLHSILGEEEGLDNGNDYKWIIDPIDGTVSFLHGQHHWGVSIALSINNEVVLGALYNPAYNYLFFAEKGKGATLNNKKINPSFVDTLDKACVCTGFCCLRSQWKKNNLEIFNDVAKQVQGIRRLGSIASDIAFVACGKLDACWEMNVNLYDVAAALLIAKEAGAIVCDMEGKGQNVINFPLVTNPYLKQQMLDIFDKHEIPFENRR